jgi:hypothetical protein
MYQSIKYHITILVCQCMCQCMSSHSSINLPTTCIISQYWSTKPCGITSQYSIYLPSSMAWHSSTYLSNYQALYPAYLPSYMVTFPWYLSIEGCVVTFCYLSTKLHSFMCLSPELHSMTSQVLVYQITWHLNPAAFHQATFCHFARKP